MNKILLSRNDETVKNVEEALKQLNKYEFKKGEPVIVTYVASFGDNNYTDAVLAIGVDNGVGPNYYRIVEIKEELVVSRIFKSGVTWETGDKVNIDSTRPYKGSNYIIEGKLWKIYRKEKGIEDNSGIEDNAYYYLEVQSDGTLIGKKLTSDNTIYQDAFDNFRWFFNDGILKREDEFLTRTELDDIINEALYETIEPTMIIEALNSDKTAYNNSVERSFSEPPVFRIAIKDCKDNIITDECSDFTISYLTKTENTTIENCLTGNYDSLFIELTLETPEKLANGSRIYTISNYPGVKDKTTWFKISAKTKYNKILTKYYFVSVDAKVEITIDVEVDVTVEGTTEKKSKQYTIDPETNQIDAEFPDESLGDLNNNTISIFVKNELNKEIIHIYDIHGLDYLPGDYKVTNKTDDAGNVVGTLYTKLSPVTSTKSNGFNFHQIIEFKDIKQTD